MLNHRIERADWGAFFDRLTAGHPDVPGQATARLQVHRPDGDASRADVAHDRAWRPFVGVTWAPAQDTITVALDGLDHRIEDPLVVWADDSPDGSVRRLVILGARGRRDVVAFKRAGLQG
jgi:hypothetical protein